MIYRGLFSARDLLEQVAELIENSCGIARHETALRARAPPSLFDFCRGAPSVSLKKTRVDRPHVRAVTAPRPIYQNVYSLCLQIFWSGSVTVQ